MTATTLKLSGHNTMNDATTIREVMPSVRASPNAIAKQYSDEVNAVYFAVLDKCKEVSAAGKKRLRFNDWPVACSEEAKSTALERLLSQRFTVVEPMKRDAVQFLLHQGTKQQRLYNIITNRFAVGWEHRILLYCDALYVQWLNQGMVQAGIDRTALKVYSVIIQACNKRAYADHTTHSVDIQELIGNIWDISVSPHVENLCDIASEIKALLTKQGFNITECDTNTLIISWLGEV